MRTEIYEVKIQGIVCRQCVDIINESLLNLKGVLDVNTSYIKNKVAIKYDPDILAEEQINTLLEKIGYPKGESNNILVIDTICLISAIVFFFIFKYVPSMIKIPELHNGASYGFIFLIGLFTSTHCLGMCGGIMLSQTTVSVPAEVNKKRINIVASLLYNSGRIITCTVIGLIFGAVGAVLTYTATIKSIVFTLAGAVVLIIGLNMWGIIPGLRYLAPQSPSACDLPKDIKKKYIGKPFVVGLLTGLMPCASSYAMWVYSMSTGSALSGCLTMLIWSLGTVPLMMFFGTFGSLIPSKYSKWLVKICAVLVVALGFLMLTRGISIFNTL